MDLELLSERTHVGEEWRFIPEFDNYLVSNYGRVYNAIRQELLAGTKVHNGAVRVKLRQEGAVREVHVHSLVVELFFDDYYYGCHVRHKNGNKYDNHISNLEPVGPFRGMGPNYRPEYKGGRLVRIVETDEVFPNVMTLAIALETDVSTIYKCLRGDRQSHLGFTYEYAD